MLSQFMVYFLLFTVFVFVKQGFGNKSITLYDIRAELNHRYKDMRVPFQSANPEEIFDMLTKESPETFYIGKMVTATVIGNLKKVSNFL